MKKILLFLIFFLLSAQFAYACIGDNITSCSVDSDCCLQNNLICLHLSTGARCLNPLNAQCAVNGQLGGQWYGGDGVIRNCTNNQTCISQSGGSTLIPCSDPTPTPTPVPTLAPCTSPGFCSLNTCPS